ncbi:MAG: type II secretion system F family protein [Leisingera sp.]
MTRLSSLSQLSQAIELLLTSGMPLPDAFRQAAGALGGASGYHATFLEAAEAVEGGLNASAAIEADPFIPASFKELFRIGEETNRLPSTLAALAETMSAQADRQSQRILGLLTPILTLIIGSGVGFLIYTLMGAILEINEIAF